MTTKERYDSLFRWYAEVSSVDWRLLKCQVEAESAFNPKAVSPVGAAGLAQFMRATWMDWSPGGDRFNPEDSIEAQAKYMRHLLDLFKEDVKLALAAYNWGMGHVRKNPDPDSWPSETRRYVEKIVAALG